VARLPARQRDDDPVLGPDLALHRPVNTSSVRKAPLHADGSRDFGGECAIDGDDKTYWSPADPSVRDEENRRNSNDRPPRAATLEIDMEGPVRINALSLGEAPGFEQHVQAYKVEGQVDSDWKLLSDGTTIGQLKTDRFADTTVWKVRLTIVKSQEQVAIRKLALYDHQTNRAK
jgi:alpha-L-fucosidase